MPARIEIDETKALDLYNQGKGDSNIAASLGVSYSTIVRWRAAHCLPSHSGKVPAARQSKNSVSKKPIEAIPKQSAAAAPLDNIPDLSPACPSASPQGLMETLTKLFQDHPCADVCIDGLPIKSITVLSEYDLLGNQRAPHINLLSE